MISKFYGDYAESEKLDFRKVLHMCRWHALWYKALKNVFAPRYIIHDTFEAWSGAMIPNINIDRNNLALQYYKQFNVRNMIG